MIVTKLEEYTKTKYRVFLDNEFAFVLYKGELSRYRIKEGSELSDEIYEQIMDKVIFKRAKLRAMHLLEAMDRTEAGLRDKLKTGGYPEEAVDHALAYVKSFGYINDFRYAVNFIDNRKESKSRRQIYALLSGKGIDRDTMDQAFEECYEPGDEKEAVLKLIRKKKINPDEASPEELQRLYGYLARKGFRYDDIRQVIQDYDENA